MCECCGFGSLGMSSMPRSSGQCVHGKTARSGKMIEEPAHKDFIECLNGAAALLCFCRATDVLFIFDDREDLKGILFLLILNRCTVFLLSM